MGIALSKQLCGKPVGHDLWLLEDVAGHWDQLKRAHSPPSTAAASRIRTARWPACGRRPT